MSFCCVAGSTPGLLQSAALGPPLQAAASRPPAIAIAAARAGAGNLGRILAIDGLFAFAAEPRGSEADNQADDGALRGIADRYRFHAAAVRSAKKD